MSLGNDVNNYSSMSAIKPLNVMILTFIYLFLTFKGTLCVLCMMLLAASPLTQVLTRRLTGVTLRCLQCSVKCRWFRNLALSISSFSHSRTCISVQARNQGGGVRGVRPNPPFREPPFQKYEPPPLKLSNSISGIGFQSCPFLV